MKNVHYLYGQRQCYISSPIFNDGDRGWERGVGQRAWILPGKSHVAICFLRNTDNGPSLEIQMDPSVCPCYSYMRITVKPDLSSHSDLIEDRN